MNQYVQTDPVERFWAKVRSPLGIGECWEWLASKSIGGYGVFGEKKPKNTYSHRFAYCQLFGIVPEGKELDHLCRNRLCVNPYHLEPLTKRENILRGEGFTAAEARRTHCPKGHPLEGDNLSKAHLRVGKRVCRVCVNEWERERYRTNAAYRQKSITDATARNRAKKERDDESKKPRK